MRIGIATVEVVERERMILTLEAPWEVYRINAIAASQSPCARVADEMLIARQVWERDSLSKRMLPKAVRATLDNGPFREDARGVIFASDGA